MNGRIEKVKRMLEKEQKNYLKACENLNKQKNQLPSGVDCELIENFVCFPLGQRGILFSLIDDKSLFPIPIFRNRIYEVNMLEGFGTIKEINVDQEKAA